MVIKVAAVPVCRKRVQEVDAALYAEVTVRLQDNVTRSSVEFGMTKNRLLAEGDWSFFACFFRFHPDHTVCEANIEESVHEQLKRYLLDMNVVGGDKLEGVAEMFSLEELSQRLRPFRCANCRAWIDPIAPRVPCVFRRVLGDGRCIECGAVSCQHVHRLPWHVPVRCSAD